MKCNCDVYEHDICFDGVITSFSHDCLCCRNTSEGQEAVVEVFNKTTWSYDDDELEKFLKRMVSGR